MQLGDHVGVLGHHGLVHLEELLRSASVQRKLLHGGDLVALRDDAIDDGACVAVSEGMGLDHAHRAVRELSGRAHALVVEEKVALGISGARGEGRGGGAGGGGGGRGGGGDHCVLALGLREGGDLRRGVVAHHLQGDDGALGEVACAGGYGVGGLAVVLLRLLSGQFDHFDLADDEAELGDGGEDGACPGQGGGLDDTDSACLLLAKGILCKQITVVDDVELSGVYGDGGTHEELG